MIKKTLNRKKCTNILVLTRVIQHAAIKEQTRKEYYRREQAILKTECYSANLEAINTLEIPVVTKSFNIINWTIPEIRGLDTKISY